ncbi:hypothetical protein EV175_005567 [Coemansia sp. RSA 1933]|nr:hypothetical protein EV175_005567 [Coemansia sp. RSA 1933]
MKVFFTGILALTVAAVAVSAAPADNSFDPADFSNDQSHPPHEWGSDMSDHERPSDFSGCGDFSDMGEEGASDEDGHSWGASHKRQHGCHPPMSGEPPSGEAPSGEPPSGMASGDAQDAPSSDAS